MSKSGGRGLAGSIEYQLCGQSGSMLAMAESLAAVGGRDVALADLARHAVVGVIEVPRVGRGDVEGDRVRARRVVGVIDRLAQRAEPESPVFVTTKLGPPRGTTGENSDVLFAGPLPGFVMSVAVAVTNGSPAGSAGRSAVKFGVARGANRHWSTIQCTSALR